MKDSLIDTDALLRAAGLLSGTQIPLDALLGAAREAMPPGLLGIEVTPKMLAALGVTEIPETLFERGSWRDASFF